MDEGTAHLDVELERAVAESLRSLAITRVIIAHRPETIRVADRVAELKDGVLHVHPPKRDDEDFRHQITRAFASH